MHISTGRDIDELDDALTELRRLGERRGFRLRFLAELGDPVEFSTLRTLRAIERRADEDVSVGVVADALGVDPSTASRLVERAVAPGYLRRRPAPDDRRRARLELTEEGERLLARASQVRRSLIAEIVDDWSGEEVSTFVGLLQRLKDGFDQFEQQPCTSGEGAAPS